jgi:hypothetical protein
VGEPRYETAYEQLQRIGHTDSVVCTDCGVFVMNVAAHNRFHSILASHAWTLAVLKTTHVAAHVHDKYDAVERIDSRKFDNWSADALAEVTGQAAKQFAEAYASRSHTTVAELRRMGRYPQPCHCQHPDCQGWQMGHQHEDALCENRCRGE